jgi:hypothetical protein
MSSMALGALIGLLTPLAIYFSDRIFRLDDRAAVLVVHGLAGLTGLLAVGILADGTAGQGWNDVTAGGVTGLFATDGAQAGAPGQLQAQAVGAAVLASLGFFGAWLCFAPLALLARSAGAGLRTKSGLVVGMGETEDEILATLADLAAVGVSIVTIGQYLRPTSHHLPVARWWEPEAFERFASAGRRMGIDHVESSPCTRSSYHARSAADAAG